MPLPIPIPGWRAWFRTLWPHTGSRLKVLDEYRQLGTKPHLLADIRERGGLGKPATVPGDPYASAFYDGRRSLAEEILDLAKADHQRLVRLIEEQPKP